MMGEPTVVQEALFYSFSFDRHVSETYLLHSIGRFVDLTGIANIFGLSTVRSARRRLIRMLMVSTSARRTRP